MYNLYITVCNDDKGFEDCCHDVDFDNFMDGKSFANIINTISPDNLVELSSDEGYKSYTINTVELKWIKDHSTFGIYEMIVENEDRMEEVLLNYGNSSG